MPRERELQRAPERPIVHLALDEIVLRARLRGRHADLVISKPGHHDHARGVRHFERAAKRLESRLVGQAEVEQHDVRFVGMRREVLERVVERLDVQQGVRLAAFLEHFVHEAGVARVVLDQQDSDREFFCCHDR